VVPVFPIDPMRWGPPRCTRSPAAQRRQGRPAVQPRQLPDDLRAEPEQRHEPAWAGL